MTRSHPLPHRAHTIGMWVFLASLGMLFVATMLLYVLTRVMNENAPAFGSINLPPQLIVSTVLMLLGSFTIHRALVSIRRERQMQFRQWLVATTMLAGLFVAVQTPAMVTLYKQNTAAQEQFRINQTKDANQQQLTPAYRNKPPTTYVVIFFLILLHALHVVGGVIGLGLVAWNGFRGKYDHEHYAGVKHAVLYWHFLDVVWIVMYSVIFAFK